MTKIAVKKSATIDNVVAVEGVWVTEAAAKTTIFREIRRLVRASQRGW